MARSIKNRYPFFLILLHVGIWLAACLPIKNRTQETLEIPQSYGNRKDSSNIVELKWNHFISDSNLTSLISSSLSNNQDLLISLQRIETYKADVLYNKGLLWPTLSANGSLAQRRFGKYTMDGAGNASTPIYGGKLIPTDLPDYYLGFQSSWEIDIWGKLRSRKKAAFNRLLASIEGRNLIITQLIYETALAYYEIIALDNELDVVNKTIQIQQKALSVIQIQKESGRANELAVQQFEAQLLKTKSRKVQIIQSILEWENKINFLLGRFPQAIVRDKNHLTDTLHLNLSVGLPSSLLLNRPDIRQAESELAASKADAQATRMAFLPSFNITGNSGFQSFKPDLLFITPASITYGIMGNLSAPLLNRSALKASYKNANARQQEAFYNYQKAIINGYVEVYNEVNNLRNLAQIVKYKEEQSNLLSKAIETSAELFSTGRANYLEVLFTQQNALEAQLELIESRKRQAISGISLYKALGGGWK